jgi:uncharacterized membrane protein
MTTETAMREGVTWAEAPGAERASTRTSLLGMDNDRVAQGLGWFSIGLGLAELIAPRSIARIVGASNHRAVIRAYGLREIAAGIGILTTTRRADWLWGRVAGDAMDLVSLGKLAKSDDSDRGKTIFGIAAVAGVTALDICCAERLSRKDASQTWARAEANMIIDRPPEECYSYWRNFENFPRFMSYLESVQNLDDGVSHWVAKGPGNVRIEWDAHIENDIPNKRLAWRSLEGSEVWHTGSVDFEPAPADRGTIIRVQMDYGHSFRALGAIATLMGKDPEQMIRKELRRFKQVMETGEVITTEGQPSGRASGATWLDNVAR